MPMYDAVASARKGFYVFLTLNLVPLVFMVWLYSTPGAAWFFMIGPLAFNIGMTIRYHKMWKNLERYQNQINQEFERTLNGHQRRQRTGS